MTTSTRLKKVEQNLSVKQIVLLMIQEARQHPSMIAHARALTAAGCIPAETLCDKIEDAVDRAHRGLPRADKNRLIRAAQRDGLFLGRLVQECNFRLLSTAREHRLEVALLHAWVLMCAWDPDEGRSMKKLGPWLEISRAVLQSMRDELEAVRFVEREYFDGARVLYTHEETELVENIGQIKVLLDALEGVVGGEVKTGTRAKRSRGQRGAVENGRHALSPGALQKAESLILAAKVKVLDEFNQTREAAKVLTRHMATIGLVDQSDAGKGTP
jgi:hypothetical protein